MTFQHIALVCSLKVALGSRPEKRISELDLEVCKKVLVFSQSDHINHTSAMGPCPDGMAKF